MLDGVHSCNVHAISLYTFRVTKSVCCSCCLADMDFSYYEYNRSGQKRTEYDVWIIKEKNRLQKMKNIKPVSDSYLCSNCGACYAICPKEAISFEITSIGRHYATVNDKCVDCGLCQKVCPSLDLQNLHSMFEDRYIGQIIKTYIGRATNDKIFRNAQSGGVATAIVAYLLDEGLVDAAVVCKMEFGSTPKVVPFVVENVNQLYDTQRSCYTPVTLLTALTELSNKNSVAIVGIPCHIEGITSLMKVSNKFANISYKIGLVCDRTECETLQDVIKSFTPPSGIKIKISWRRKFMKQNNTYNYKQAPIEIEREDGSISVLPRHYRTALKEMFTPPRCRLCYDKINIFADIVLGDPWRLEGVDNLKGESLVFSRTDKGQQLLYDMLQNGCLSMRDLNDNSAPLRSQIIDERRKNVASSSKVFASVFPQKIESYLLHQDETVSVSKSVVDKAEDILKTFIFHENKTKQEIIAIAREYLAKYKPQKKSFINRLFSKVKRMLK